jgi:hypothetical protein
VQSLSARGRSIAMQRVLKPIVLFVCDSPDEAPWKGKWHAKGEQGALEIEVGLTRSNVRFMAS